MLGGIGRTERENRDNMRVFSRGGYSPTLKAHIATDKIIEVQDRVRVLSGGGICQGLRATDYKDPPKVVKRCRKKIK